MRRRLLPRVTAGLAAALVAGAAVLATAAPASAHVVPSTVVEMDVHAGDITADLTLPAEDLATASGLDIPLTGDLADSTADQVAAYVEDHVVVTSASGTWDIDVADVASTDVEQWGTGAFPAVTATATLTPPDPADLRSFVLDYDAIVHQVVTADVYVVLRSDEAAGAAGNPRTLGALTTDTVTGEVPSLAVDLDEGSTWPGFTGMVTLGMSHIAEGTDHQLFLLTLLLPAPLLAARRRWNGVTRTGLTARRITAITLAFTAGHSVTLAAGALGLPVPAQPVEAAIAVSILIAAAHAVRPLFPGREAAVAGLFGLVHGMAFSMTLTEMDLTGPQLVLSLLGFNLGIEIMQLAVVLLVLPPLVVLARTPAYRYLRDIAAVLTALAATGWLLQRLGLQTPLGTAADTLGPATPWVAAALWATAIAVAVHQRRSTSPARPRQQPLPARVN